MNHELELNYLKLKSIISNYINHKKTTNLYCINTNNYIVLHLKL